MAFESFGEVSIFRPSQRVETLIRNRARSHLFSAFEPGEYHTGEQANRIIQHQFRVYEQLLRPVVPKLTSRGAAEFLLYQYDQAWKLVHGNDILDLQERSRWAWIEPRLKRAIKFLLELICQADGTNNDESLTSREEAEFVMEVAVACAENMVDLAMQSDTVHSVFPRDAVVTIFDGGVYDYSIEIRGQFTAHDEMFSARVIRDRQSRHRFVPQPQFDQSTPLHQTFLDNAFRDEFHMTYGEFIAALVAIINHSQPSLHPRAFPTLFVNRRQVVDELAKSGGNRCAIERAIDGFSVIATKLTAEKRVVWRPKQETRAYRRGFFVLSHETGPHLAFSRGMAQESLIQLVNWVSYKHLPVEWRTAGTSRALAALAQKAGTWFEQVMQARFRNLGFFGDSAKKTIGRKPHVIAIPADIGELDFIGYHGEQRLLALGEAKMTMSGLEAAYWRDDLHEYVFRNGSYAERFRQKLKWVSANRKSICNALGVSAAEAVGGVMLTLYPCIARAFIRDFPCVSITEFMLDHEEHHGRWPYNFV